MRLGPLTDRTIGARRPLIRVALRHRLFPAPLLAFVILVQERALGAGDLAALVAVGLVAMFADQRANPGRLQLDRIERIEACKLDVKFGSGVRG
ncbi:hypothetical protein ACVIM9_002756 [Bradyrhizobium sp. USDA 4520]